MKRTGSAVRRQDDESKKLANSPQGTQIGSKVLGASSKPIVKSKTLKPTSQVTSFDAPKVDDEVFHGRRKETNYLVGPIDLEPELAREIS